MKYQENISGQRKDFSDFIKKTVPDLFAGRLTVEGKNVVIPNDCDLDYKTKFDEEENGGSFLIKVSWQYPTQEDELI